MRNKILWMVCAATAFGVGCTDRSPGGEITLMDSGTSSTDAGTSEGMDDTVPNGMCSITGLMPLPAPCLPRCAPSTIGAMEACLMMDAGREDILDCRDRAFAADPTAPITVSTPGNPIEGDCEFCWEWQTNVAFAESCPSEFQAYLMCAGMASADCTAQAAALDSCINANQAAINGRVQALVSQCFPATSGFLPGLQRGPQLPSWYPVDIYLSLARRFHP